MAAVRLVEFGCGKGRPPMKCNCWSTSDFDFIRFVVSKILRFLNLCF